MGLNEGGKGEGDRGGRERQWDRELPVGYKGKQERGTWMGDDEENKLAEGGESEEREDEWLRWSREKKQKLGTCCGPKPENK